MSDTQETLAESILEALESGESERIIAICRDSHPGDIETAFERLDDEQRDTVLQALPADVFSELADYLPAAVVDEGLDTLEDAEKTEVLDAMADDELADLLQEVDDDDRSEYLELLTEPDRALDLMQFPETTAGGRMTTGYGKVHISHTVAEAIEELRGKHDEAESLSRIFVVDESEKLLGMVRLRDLTFADRTSTIDDLVDRVVISIKAHADQEEAAGMISRYDLLSLPVVDEFNRLLGVITHDDALDILEEESTEDIEKISGIGGERGDLAYLQTKVLTHFKRRSGWVVILAFLALISGFVFHKYEDVLTAFFVLSLYLPMVVAAGGNTGAQAATMVIRAMSLGELHPSEFLRVVWKEARIGLLLGSLLAICVSLQILFILPAQFVGENASLPQVAAIVAISLMLQVLTSTVIGAALPLGARAAKLDPAVVASPAITTIVDVSGMIIYFTLAQIFLRGAGVA